MRAPNFAEDRETTTRMIPVVALKPA